MGIKGWDGKVAVSAQGVIRKVSIQIDFPFAVNER